MVGVTLKDGYVNKALAAELIDAGLLVLTAGQNVLRLLPPLVITKEELEKGLDIMAQVLC